MLKTLGLIASILLFYATPAVGEPIRFVAVEEPPTSYLNEKGQAYGYFIDIVKAMFQHSREYSIEFVPEVRAIKYSNSQPNVILVGISKTAARSDQYLWIGKLTRKPWLVYALKQSKLEINHLNDLKHLESIGVVRGDVRESWLQDQGFKNLNSLTYHRQNVMQLFKGRVNAIAYEPQGFNFTAARVGLDPNLVSDIYKLRESDVYLAIRNQENAKHVFETLFNKYEHLKQTGKLKQISLKWQAYILERWAIATQIDGELLSF